MDRWRILACMSAADHRLELTVLRQQLDDLVRRRYAAGLTAEERDTYQRLTAREIELLRALGAGLPASEPPVAAEG